MKAFFFASMDFLWANRRRIGLAFLWAVSITFVLLSLTALWTIPTQDEPAPPASQRFFLLTLSPLLSEAEINELAWEIWSWPEVQRVAFRFPGESEPEPVSERTLVVEIQKGTDSEGTGAKLQGFPEVTKVTVVERTFVPAPAPSAARIGAVAALILSLGLALFLGVVVTTRTQKGWARELRLLRESGAPWWVWRGPRFLLGGLVGILGAGLHVAALYVGMQFIPPDSGWAELLRTLPKVLAVSPPVGLLLGLLGTLLSPHS